jgi:hypothetical protein
MEAADQSHDPASFLAAAAALSAIEQAVLSARAASGRPRPEPEQATPEQALAALLLLREVREQLAGWESGLIETARSAGASWADLARPLGVASRQAAERRYLRVRPGDPGTTGEQRVQATRDDRAARRSVTEWARDNAADLRQLAGQITALTTLPASARAPQKQLADALADNDPAQLLIPLASTYAHLEPAHRDLATRIKAITRHTEGLRQNGGSQPPDAA